MDSSSYQSSEHTPAKQSHLRYVLERELAVIGVIREKYGWARLFDPIFIDLTAGPGRNPQTGEPGSPLIFFEVSTRHEYSVEAHFYERQDDAARQLAYHLSQVSKLRSKFVVHPCDNLSVADILPKRTNHSRFGIAYGDTSNGDLPALFAPLRMIANAYPRVDLLINYSAASWKRQVNLARYKNLLELMPTIPKQNWLIREPIGKHQWTMLLATNWLDYSPEEQRRWHNATRSKIGRELLAMIAYTNDQRGTFGNQLSLI